MYNDIYIPSALRVSSNKIVYNQIISHVYGAPRHIWLKVKTLNLL